MRNWKDKNKWPDFSPLDYEGWRALGNVCGCDIYREIFRGPVFVTGDYVFIFLFKRNFRTTFCQRHFRTTEGRYLANFCKFFWILWKFSFFLFQWCIASKNKISSGFSLLCGTMTQAALRQIDAIVKCLNSRRFKYVTFFLAKYLGFMFFSKKIEKMENCFHFFKLWWWIVSELTPESRKCTEFTAMLFASLFENKFLFYVEK